MQMLEKIAKGTGLFVSDAASLLKVALLSRRGRKAAPVTPGRELIIMGNGPSLRQTLDTRMPLLKSRETMAVNFAANAPEFRELSPDHYILADPHFFDATESDPNVRRLWVNLRAVEEPMTLHVPAARLAQAKQLAEGSLLKFSTFNLTPLEGHGALCRLLMRRGLGMPRPRNVLIAAIMVALNMGYGRLYLVGADHSWSRTLSVDDKNRVLSVQPHFYSDNPAELDRVAAEYAGYHLHDILGSLTVAFRSYFAIKDYAAARGQEILNATPGSMIDAFERQPLPER